jgi:1-acyl-sn-glycerol-3-phosphate acyltransferase
VTSERGEHPDPGGDGAAELLLSAVDEIVADVGRGRHEPLVGLDSRLDADLGLDSLSVAELLVRTEELFGVSLSEEVLATARTPRDLLTAATMANDPVPRGSPGDDPDVGDPDDVALAPARPASVRSGGRARRAAADVYGVWTLALFGVLAAVAWLLIVLAPTLQLRWRLLRGTGRLLAALVGVRVRVEGAHHLPRGRPFVVVANHASHVDPLVLVRVLEEPAVFAAVAALADNPLVRLGLRRLAAHLVARGDRVRGVADAGALTDTVRAGRSVVFFPEGRRSPGPGLEPFRMGAFLVAARSGAPVVPIALQGTRAVLPVGRLLPRRATVTMTVGPPVTTRVTGWRGAVELQREARRVILGHADEPDLA